MAGEKGIDNVREAMAKGRAARADALNRGKQLGTPDAAGGPPRPSGPGEGAGAAWRPPEWLPGPGEGGLGEVIDAPSTPGFRAVGRDQSFDDYADLSRVAPAEVVAPDAFVRSGQESFWFPRRERPSKRFGRWLKDTFWSKEDMRWALGTSGGIAAFRLGVGFATGGQSEMVAMGLAVGAGVGRAAVMETRSQYKKQRAELEGRNDLTAEEQARLDNLRGNLLKKLSATKDKRKIAGAMVTAGAMSLAGWEFGKLLREWGVADLITQFAREHITATLGTLGGAGIRLWNRYQDSKNGGDTFFSRKTAINTVVGGLIGGTLGTGWELIGPPSAGFIKSGLGGAATATATAVKEATAGVAKPALPAGSPGAVESPVPSPAASPAVRPAVSPAASPVASPEAPKAVTSPSPVPSPVRPDRLPTPGTIIEPKPRVPTPGTIIEPKPRGAWLPGRNFSSLDGDVLRISYERPLVPNLLEIRAGVPSSAVDRLMEGISNGNANLPGGINMEPNVWNQIKSEISDGNSFLYSPDANDAINLPSTQDLVLTEPDKFSPTSLGPDYQNWSSLKGKVEAWATQDFFDNHDPKILAEMDSIIKDHQVNLGPGEKGVFFGDENPGIPEEMKFWNAFKAGRITEFNPYDANHARLLEIMKQTPTGKELFNKQFIGGYINAKLNNPEDPANLGAIFNKNNSDYFKHGTPLKIAEPEKLMTDLRKAV